MRATHGDGDGEEMFEECLTSINATDCSVGRKTDGAWRFSFHSLVAPAPAPTATPAATTYAQQQWQQQQQQTHCPFTSPGLGHQWNLGS